MTNRDFPPGWDERRVREVLAHYESQDEDEQFAEIEAARGLLCGEPSWGQIARTDCGGCTIDQLRSGPAWPAEHSENDMWNHLE